MISESAWITSILHPSDLAEESAQAFAHALALALLEHCRFTILHAQRPGSAQEWRQAPSVRRTLESWGLLAPGSEQSAVFHQLAIDVRKVTLGEHDPIQAILLYLESYGADLLVLGTAGREGLPRWLKPSFAEQVSRRSKSLTLFVPHFVPGFVNLESGQIEVQRILIPVDYWPHPAPALTCVVRMIQSLGVRVEVTLLHVGEEPFPWPHLPSHELILWRQEQRQGAVVDQIIHRATTLQPDLILTTTQEHQGIWDVLRGSTTHQVLRKTPCPLLAVPATRIDPCTGGKAQDNLPPEQA